MSVLFGLLISLIFIGFALYIIQLIPMDATIKQVIRAVAILIVCLWALSALGLLPGPFPRWTW